MRILLLDYLFLPCSTVAEVDVNAYKVPLFTLFLTTTKFCGFMPFLRTHCYNFALFLLWIFALLLLVLVVLPEDAAAVDYDKMPIDVSGIVVEDWLIISLLFCCCWLAAVELIIMVLFDDETAAATCWYYYCCKISCFFTGGWPPAPFDSNFWEAIQFWFKKAWLLLWTKLLLYCCVDEYYYYYWCSVEPPPCDVTTLLLFEADWGMVRLVSLEASALL